MTIEAPLVLVPASTQNPDISGMLTANFINGRQIGVRPDGTLYLV